MRKSDTVKVLAVVRMLWSHSNLGDDPVQVLETWHSFLAGLDFADVDAAVRELAAGGREHAPPVGVVVQMATARRVDAPAWDEAWDEVQGLIRRHGSYRVPDADRFSSPVVARFAVAAWAELCAGPAAGTNGYGTFYAQQRDAYQALSGRVRRDMGLLAVGAPRESSMRRLSAVNMVTGKFPQIAENAGS